MRSQLGGRPSPADMRAGVRARPHAGQKGCQWRRAAGQEGQEKHQAPRSKAPPPESRPFSVLNPSGALVPRPGQCGGEGRQRRRGGHKCTPPNLEGEKETHSGKHKTNMKPRPPPTLASPRLPVKRLLRSNSLHGSVLKHPCQPMTDPQRYLIPQRNKCLSEITRNL